MIRYCKYLLFCVIMTVVSAIHKSTSLRMSSTSTTSNLATHSNNVVETKPIKGLLEGIKIRKISNSDLCVSEVGLGTMNFGDQLSEKMSIDILDSAVDEYGINFIDTAESYPAPSAPSTTGESERIVGRWMKLKKNREKIVLSTKICGFSDQITWCRKDGSGTRLSKAQIFEAVDSQLQRLGTDYIDLLQLHWPERYVPLYGAPEYQFALENRMGTSSMKEQLEALTELKKQGKIKNFGLSNETPYGIGAFTTTADLCGLDRPVVTQNCYNLLVRNDFESGMIEACSINNGNLGLIAYSPLAGGALTGKYLDTASIHQDYRLQKYIGFMHRYISSPAADAIREYMEVAESFSLPLAPLALSFVYSRPFVASTLIGVTSKEQLKQNLLALNIPTTPEMLEAFNGVYRHHMDPTKGIFEVIDPTKEYVDPAKLPWGAKDEDVDPELDVLINQRMSRF